MAYSFFIETNPQFGAQPGYQPVVYFQDVNNFSSIAEAPATATNEGDTVTITGDHTFTAEHDGFVEAHTYRDGSEITSTSSGEPGFIVEEWSLKFMIVGDSAQVKEKAYNMLNRGLILMFPDPDCNSTRIQQLGCGCNPAVVKSVKASSGTIQKGGSKGYEIEVSCTCPPQDYQGTITFKTAG